MATDERVRILTLDPGERVGWARVTYDPDLPWAEMDWNHGILELKPCAMALVGCNWSDPNEVLAVQNYDRVVFETWRLRGDKAAEFAGSDFPSVQFVGMLRLAAWCGGAKLYPQHPKVQAFPNGTARKTAPLYIQEIVAREPKRHDDAHNVSALLHLWHHLWHYYVKTGVRRGKD